MWILLKKPSDQDLQCFQKRINTGSEGQGLKRNQTSNLFIMKKFSDYVSAKFILGSQNNNNIILI